MYYKFSQTTKCGGKVELQRAKAIYNDFGLAFKELISVNSQNGFMENH